MINGRHSELSVTCCVFLASVPFPATGPALGTGEGDRGRTLLSFPCPPQQRACGRHILTVLRTCPGPRMGWLSVATTCLGTQAARGLHFRDYGLEKSLRPQNTRPTSGFSGHVLPCRHAVFLSDSRVSFFLCPHQVRLSSDLSPAR